MNDKMTEKEKDKKVNGKIKSVSTLLEIEHGFIINIVIFCLVIWHINFTVFNSGWK